MTMRSGQTHFTEVPQTSHYPDVDRAVIAVAKNFAPGVATGFHAHDRAQLIMAVTGVMAAVTEAGTWVIPPRFALWVPAHMKHDVAMHGEVAMRTAYVAPEASRTISERCKVIEASPLLEAAIISLAQEPPSYGEHGRGHHLACIITDEIARAPSTPFALPMPRDPRLLKLVKLLVAQPSQARTLDEWADHLAMTRRTFTRRFRLETGLSVAAWIRRLRLLKAITDEADGKPAAQTAGLVGYRSVAAFRAMAKREFQKVGLARTGH